MQQKPWAYQEVKQNKEKGPGEDPFWWPKNTLVRKNVTFTFSVYLCKELQVMKTVYENTTVLLATRIV